jgi:hypothetical protein
VVVAALACLAAFAALAAALSYRTWRVGSAVDLFLPWWTLREAWATGQSPYAEALGMAARAARFYGDPPPWPQHPYRFAYPLSFAFFVAPLLPLEFPWAAAIWMALVAVATGACALLLCRLLDWPATPRGRLLAALAAALFYPSLISVLLGQITAIPLALLLGGLLAARQKRDAVAGALLAGCTVKPQIVWLALPLLLAGALRERRWRLLGAFGATLAALTCLPMLWQPAWPLDFLRSLGGYAGDEPTPSALLLLGHLVFSGRLDSAWAGAPAAVAVVGGAALVLAVAVRAWPAPARALPLLMAVTLVVTPLRAQTAQMVLLIPLFDVLARAGRRTSMGAALIGAGAVAASWVLVASRTDPPDFFLRQLLPPLVGLALVVPWGVRRERAPDTTPAGLSAA